MWPSRRVPPHPDGWISSFLFQSFICNFNRCHKMRPRSGMEGSLWPFSVLKEGDNFSPEFYWVPVTAQLHWREQLIRRILTFLVTKGWQGQLKVPWTTHRGAHVGLYIVRLLVLSLDIENLRCSVRIWNASCLLPASPICTDHMLPVRLSFHAQYRWE